MNETDIHHAGGHFVAFGADEGFDVFAVRAWLRFFVAGTRPCSHEEVVAANACVTRRIVGVREVRLGGEITFELDPVEPLDIFVRADFNEGVQFAVGDSIKDPAVRAEVFGGCGQLNPEIGVAVGGDG